MNGCPKNKTTGKPYTYGIDACQVYKRRFLEWQDTRFAVIERHQCAKCGLQFEYPKEDSQIPRKAS